MNIGNYTTVSTTISHVFNYYIAMTMTYATLLLLQSQFHNKYLVMKSESPVSRHFRNNGLSTIVAITAPQHKKTFCRQTLCQVSKKHDLYNDATNSLGPRYEVLSKVKSYYAEMPQSLDCNVFTPSIHRSRSVATVVDSPTTALQHKQSSSIVCLNTINMILYCFSNNKKYDKIIHQVSTILCFLSSS